VTKKGYALGFYFWIDCIVCASLLFEVLPGAGVIFSQACLSDEGVSETRIGHFKPYRLCDPAWQVAIVRKAVLGLSNAAMSLDQRATVIVWGSARTFITSKVTLRPE
jgi:hypothetical protein